MSFTIGGAPIKKIIISYNWGGMMQSANGFYVIFGDNPQKYSTNAIYNPEDPRLEVCGLEGKNGLKLILRAGGVDDMKTSVRYPTGTEIVGNQFIVSF